MLCTIVAAPADAELIQERLNSAAPRVIEREPIAPTAPIRLGAGLGDWKARPSGIAGSSHYDSGEWIYENYPFTALGAASPGTAQLREGLDALGETLPPTHRLPGVLEFGGIKSAGAGPLADEADLAELRLSVRGSDLYVLARTTTMHANSPTALLLLFDTRPGGTSRQVPFGSGLRTRDAEVAALVTSHGAQVVDLASGATTPAQTAADPRGDANTLVARLPLSLVGSRQDDVRFVAATGLAIRDEFQLDGGGARGPLAAVAPRAEIPPQGVHDLRQALALAGHDIDPFLTTISLLRLRRGDRERLEPGTGYSVRTFRMPARLSVEEGTTGTLRHYGLYVPEGAFDRPRPATLWLHGSNETAHTDAVLQPDMYRQLGDENGAIIVAPEAGSSELSMYAGGSYLEIERAMRDAQRLLAIERDRWTVAGYSMGGYGALMLSATQPDRFAAAFAIAGPVGGQFPDDPLPIPDLIPLLGNLWHVPVEIFQGAVDTNVPLSNGLAAAERLRGLGHRYRLDILPGEHYTPGLFGDYTPGARLLNGARRVTRPAEVRLTRVMPLEHEIDRALGVEEPFSGRSMGLHFDEAWFVRDLTAVDRRAGTASISVRTGARPHGEVRTVRSSGIEPTPAHGGTPFVFEEQRWKRQEPAARPRNALTAELTGASGVRLELGRMGLTVERPLVATVRTDARTRVALKLPSRSCVSIAGARPRRRATVVLRLAAGEHRVTLRPCRRR